MFKRSVNFSPYEKDQLLQLIREYIVIFEDKRLDGVGRREKERAWLELTDRYNSLENVNLRTSRQLQACWKNLKNRARDITEACKKGTEFPFFTLASKFNSSYLPSTEEDETYSIQASVKSEQFSDPEEESKRGSESPNPPGSQGYTIDPSSSPPSSSGSPPTVTNYVYSPTSSLPISFAPVPSSLPSVSSAPTSASSSSTSSRFLPHEHVSAPSKLLTHELGSVTSKFHPQDHVSIASRLINHDNVSVTSKPYAQEHVSASSKLLSQDHVSDTPSPSNRVDSIAARLSCSVPSYRPPERSLSKSVERITNSILFERGVSEDITPQGPVTGQRPDPYTREINGVAFALHKPQDVEVVKGNYRGESLNPSQSKSTNKCSEAEQIGCRKYGNSNRPGTVWRPMTSPNPPRVGMNGHVTSRSSGRVSKAVRYKRIEHQARMRNIKYERECLETEHGLRCELLNMKIKYYRKKLDGEL